MSKAASKTMIGAFVLGAIALIVIAVAVFGSGRFFKTTQIFETYFSGSVKGLSIGSPVMFRGVQIGSVKDISLILDPKKLEFYIPVVFEIYPEKAQRLGTGGAKPTGELIKPMIDKGMRTQLIMLSLITGQLAVSVDFFEEPAKFIGLDHKYPEIPSVPSATEELQQTLQELPLREIVAKIDSVMGSVDDFVHSGDVQANMKMLLATLGETRELMDKLNDQVGPLAENLQGTSTEIRQAVASMSGKVTGEKGLIENSSKTLARAEEMLHSVQQIAQENSAMGYELGCAITDMSRSLRSVRSLTDYLERHPESIIKGKRSP
jgi:paraquat-inducible protein B